MFRVTIVCSSLIRRGPTNVIYNMLSAYYARPENVIFNIVTISPEVKDSRLQEFANLGMNIKCADIPPGIKGIFKLRKLKKVILSTTPNVIHSYGYRADIMMSLLNFEKIPKISSLFNNPYDDYPMQFGRLKGAIMAKTHLLRLKKFENVVVCSEFIKSNIERSKLRVSVIYTGVPSNHFVPLNNKERIERREILKIPQDSKVYLFIGNLINRKNPQFLINTFNRFNDSNKILIIMGDGPLMAECKNLIGDNKYIRLIGAQPGTLYYLQIADYYISASFSEGFPTAVLEAMSANVIPILSNIPPHVEMVKLLPENLIFKNNQFASIKQIISKAENLKIPARQILLDNFSADKMQQKYVEIYLELMKRYNE